MYYYSQLCLTLLIFIFFLLWGVAYPFSYRQLKVSGNHRYAHIICVVLALVIPLLPALAHLKDGYVNLAGNPHNCFGRNPSINHYMFILPLGTIVGISTYLLVIIFWIIFKVHRYIALFVVQDDFMYMSGVLCTTCVHVCVLGSIALGHYSLIVSFSSGLPLKPMHRGRLLYHYSLLFLLCQQTYYSARRLENLLLYHRNHSKLDLK